LQIGQPRVEGGGIAGAREENFAGRWRNSKRHDAAGNDQAVTRLPFVGVHEHWNDGNGEKHNNYAGKDAA